jgi:membrane-associated PAP2 superfamily phosphatase
MIMELELTAGAHFVSAGLWAGLIVCVSFQAFSYLIYILRTNWSRVAEQVTGFVSL